MNGGDSGRFYIGDWLTMSGISVIVTFQDNPCIFIQCPMTSHMQNFDSHLDFISLLGFPLLKYVDTICGIPVCFSFLRYLDLWHIGKHMIHFFAKGVDFIAAFRPFFFKHTVCHLVQYSCCYSRSLEYLHFLQMSKETEKTKNLST